MIERGRGRFRSFLLAALKNYVSNERNKAFAQKRGGGQKLLSLDLEFAENRYRLKPSQEMTPEKLFERNWAEMLIDRALTRPGSLGVLSSSAARSSFGLIFRAVEVPRGCGGFSADREEMGIPESIK